jgi:hypothetical protein
LACVPRRYAPARAPKQKKCRRPAKDADIKNFIVVAVGVKDASATYFT